MRPIPVSMLIHEAILNNVTTDENFSEQDQLVEYLYQVRFEPSSRVIVGSDNVDIQCTATMYVDGVNSHPQGVSVDVGQSVLWEGRRYIVQDVKRLYDGRNYHHLEVDLSDG